MSSHRERATEQRQEYEIKQLSADDRAGVSAYYRFEIDQGFSSFPAETTFKDMVTYRQQQIRDGRLQVSIIEHAGKVIATTVVVLENRAMGKDIAENEAYAAGTLVDPEMRGQGIGETMSAEQDRIARAAGRESIKTVIVDDNFPSMRLRLKVGYRLDGVDDTKDQPEFKFRKNLKNEPSRKKSLQEEMLAGRLGEVSTIDASSPDELLVDPKNTQLMKQVIEAGYKGVFLLSPTDFSEARSLDGNKIVFVRAEILSDSVVD